MSQTALSLVALKVQQTQTILREEHIDCWIVQFAQETGMHPDPVQPMLIGTDITWMSAFIIPAHGSPIAIVGTGDVEKVRAIGAYLEIIGYVQSIKEPLVTVLTKMNPNKIAITTSRSDHSADGITYANYQRLRQALQGTPFATQLVSAEKVVRRVRGIKLPEEVQRIRSACQLTEDLFSEITQMLRPGITGLAISDFAHHWMRERNLLPSWDAASCPCVPIGPNSPVGHVPAGDIAAQPGDTLFCDVGVIFEGYCSDMQRSWYLLRDDEDQAPPHVQNAWNVLMKAAEAGVAMMRPGTPCWKVDAAARQQIVKGGYPAPEFAFGHNLGANAHDGGGVLGPKWERYGKAPTYPIEVGQVYAVEYAVPTHDPYVGWVSVEDNLRVGEAGVEWLVPPQRELRLVRG